MNLENLSSEIEIITRTKFNTLGPVYMYVSVKWVFISLGNGLSAATVKPLV